jgi:hypothetical protein
MLTGANFGFTDDSSIEPHLKHGMNLLSETITTTVRATPSAAFAHIVPIDNAPI